MRGIILAGDAGTKLHPLTLGVPKQLLPIYDRPMVYYALNTLVQSGIKDILVITTKEHMQAFQASLKDSGVFDANIYYACQEKPEGIAQAIMIGQNFIGNDSVCLITGDTVIDGSSLIRHLEKAYNAAEKSGHATIFVDRDYDPNQYGMVVLNNKSDAYEITGISSTPNYYSITGLYVFPNRVLEHVFNIEKSERDRFEITSVSEIFHNKNKLRIQKLPSGCTWLDTSTIDALLNTSLYMKKQHSL